MVRLLSDPRELNKESHRDLLAQLRNAVSKVRDRDGNGLSVRVRDWQFVIEEGVPVAQLFLEHEPGGEGSPVSLSECSMIHRQLLDGGCFDDFSDEVSIEVGTLGIDPPLREVAEFQRAVGSQVHVETWDSELGTGRTLELVEVVASGESAKCRFRNGTEVVEIPIESMRSARLLAEISKARHKKKKK